MNYSKLQKTISSIIISFFFFGLVFRIPFSHLYQNTSAGEAEVFSIVSILVNEDVYSGVKSSVDRYAQDIQGQLEKTKVVIIPTPSDATAFQIASLNENLYYEGYEGLKSGADFESTLVGTVLIGDIPIPVVFDSGKASKTILPYTDFDDKKYKYFHKGNIYERNINNIDGGKSEIWHGVISPNTGTKATDIQAINDFFNKDHDFYEGVGQFQTEKGVVNGKAGDDTKQDYEPYVFYFDEFREEKAISYAKYKGYEAYLENKEDLGYSRFSKELADKIQKKVLTEEKEQIRDLIKDLDSTIDVDALVSGPDISKTSAISTRFITNSVAKKFLEVINSSTLGDFKKDVYNAGRYNGTGSKVNVDTIPYLISVLDAVGDEVLKGVNNHLEDRIDDFVAGGFSRDIALPTFIYVEETEIEEGSEGSGDGYTEYTRETVVKTTNENILFGQTSSGITEAYKCSFYRGSTRDGGTLTAANRGFNINHIKPDIDKCGRADTMGYWGGNSPVNLDMEKIGDGQFELKISEPTKAIEPLFDIAGGKIEKDSKWIPSPMNCMVPNYITIKKEVPQPQILSYGEGVSYSSNDPSKDGFTLPLHGESAKNWTCETENIIYNYEKTFEETFYDFGEEADGSIEAKGDILVTFSGGVTSAGEGGSFSNSTRSQFDGKGVVYVKGLGSVDYNFSQTGSLSINGGAIQKIKGGGSYDVKEGVINTFAFDGKGDFSFQSLYSKNKADYGQYNPEKPGQSCSHKVMYLEDEIIRGFQGLDGKVMIASENDGGFVEYPECKTTKKIFHYKKIPSVLIHKSPTVAELGTQIQSIMSPDLPIDTDRYVDFIGAIGERVEIKYPYLFRLKVDIGKTGNTQDDFVKVVSALDNFLDTKSAEINKKIRDNDPSSLTGNELEIYNYLKHGDYPDADFDLKSYLKGKPVKSFEIEGDSKNISYYDTLAFAIFWNNLESIPQKYKFIFENYLTDQFSNEREFALPKHKKFYEIAYLGAPGDAQNMYVTLDPEAKGENPYANIVSDNLLISSNLLSTNIGENDEGEGVFNCAPPEGVPIWEWIPAVMCRLGDLLPPKISIGTSTCSSKTVFGDSGSANNIYSYGQENQQGGNEVCSGDANENGLDDCLEQDLSQARVEASYSTKRVPYGKNVILESSILNSSGAVLSNVNHINTDFKLVKIEAPVDIAKDFNDTNTKVIYDIARLHENSEKIASKYISYKNQSIPTIDGQSKFYFTARSKDANIYFKSTLQVVDSKGNIIQELSSDISKLEIRGDSFSSTVFRIGEEGTIESGDLGTTASNFLNVFLVDETKNSITQVRESLANASLSKNKLVLSLSNFSKGGTKTALQYPLSISLEKEGEKMLEEITVTQSELSLYKGLYGLENAGEYTLFITDVNGITLSRDFSILSDVPKTIDINLGSSALESSGNISTNLIVLKDNYGNISQGEDYDLSLQVLGGGLSFVDDQGKGETTTTKNIKIYDGYRAFRLQPTGKEVNNTLVVKLKKDDELLLTVNKQIRTINNIVARVELPSEQISVGGGNYIFDIFLEDESGELISDFSSRAYLHINSAYGRVEQPYVEIKDGKAQISLSTSTVAAENVPIEINIEGLRSIIRKNISIFPGKAMKTDLILSNNKIQASNTESSLLFVELKDRYNNLVFNDNSTSITLELKDQYKRIIGVDSLSKTVSGGKTTFKINGTGIPGTAYIKTKTSPDLKGNTFDVGTGDKKKTIPGVGENATKIQSYYFWNKDHIIGKNYNSLYSVLLGAEYGDYSQEDYLAGSMIFDRDNKNLAVTSLLNNPYKFSDTLTFGAKAGINVVSSKGDLSQNIELEVNLDEKQRLYIEVHNSALNTYIGKLYYNLGDTELKACNGNSYNIGDCSIPEDTTSVSLQSTNSSYRVSALGDTLQLLDAGGKEIVGVGSDGKFSIAPFITLDVDTQLSQDFLVLNVRHLEAIIGKLIVNVEEGSYQVTRNTDTVEAKLANSQNTILLHLSSYMYGTRDIYSSGGAISKAIYYNDPFENEKDLDRFSRSSLFGLENYISESGIGWKAGNKFLLEFAAGKKVGESVQDYMSFGTINHGDPVVSLKKIKKKFKDGVTEKSFDSTIGKLLSQDYDIEDYRVFDYDNDDKEDILLIKTDGYLKLLENKLHSAEFLDKGNLAYVVDVGGLSYIQTGDFSGDGYDDIFFINNKGKPFLLNNNEKDFSRMPLEEQFQLEGKIVQIQSFDMDNDGKGDLVTLDDAGNISLFYGGGTASKPVFEKLQIQSGYGIELNSDTRNSGGFVYFDGLLQLDKQDIIDALALNESTSSENTIDESLIDGMIFAKMQYPTGALDSNITSEGVLDSLPDLGSSDLGDTGAQTQASLEDFLTEQGSVVEFSGNNNTQSTTFIRSEYSDSVGVQVEKTYTDRNGGNLQTSDLIDVEVKIKNTSSSAKNNIAYVDSVIQPFEETQNPLTYSQGKEQNAPAGYDILVDEISLGTGEEMTINYEISVLPIKFGYIKVGLFEEGEVGDDSWGDIIIKPDNKNCSQNVDIFKSVTARTYGDISTTSPKCDPEKLKLPDELERLKIDTDGNGVPDYIDEIVGSQSKQQEFGKEALADMHIDSDGDGIPDDEDDSSDFYNESGDENFLSVLESMNQSVDEISESVDTLIEGFGCGFGGGGCVSTPLNWAPLAAGQDPTLFGSPIGDGLKVGEGVPIFSAFTGINVPTPFGCYQIPAVWPVSPLSYTGVCNGTLGAGGYLGTDSSTNFVRIFATPTLTGGFGTAVCFGGPASVAGNSNPQGISPALPGGNCIVAAKPLNECSNDGSEGDPESLGDAEVFGDFGIVNANCAVEQQGDSQHSGYSTDKYLNKNFVEDYYQYKSVGVKSTTFNSTYKQALDDISNTDNNQSTNNKPLIGVNAGGANGQYEFSLELDFAGSKDGNFEDVVKIQQQRVAGFPGFLMDWVTRQTEEIITKLTDFPTLFVILPGFGGIVDTDWGDYSNVMLPEKTNKIKETQLNKKSDIDDRVERLSLLKSGLDCSGDDEMRCLVVDIQKGNLSSLKNRGGQETISGIRTVYDFLGNVPIVSVKPQQVNIEFPWGDESTWNRAILSRELTLEQRKEEASKYLETPNVSADAGYSVDTSGLISSLEKNIQTLKGYKEIPTKLSRLLNQKEIRLGQILCNVDAISSLTGDRIGFNGKRFRAWVELYIVIKALLKSWQLLVDVFVDYEAECHECKNERQDLLNYEFSLISMIMPKIPVIQFPKWPDIILDLHNIRAGLTVLIPDFNITQRPIVLPNLPELHLPDLSANASADFNIDLPEVPLLPELTIPELPDLPSLPTVELPNLPPPPTIPKLFSSLEGILNILQLVTKAMCILKTSPFVPEWRSGDQIAFLTERSGFMPTDFLDLTLPEFSFPFVDAIKVTSWVNLEFEMEFLTEMAKQIAEPINSSTSNLTNKFSNAGINSLDFSNYSKDLDIDAEINIDTNDIEGELDISTMNGSIKLGDFTQLLAGGILKLFNYIDTNKEVEVDSKEFITLVYKSLSEREVTSNQRMEKVVAVWDEVSKQTYAKEDALIADLQKNNTEKFEALSQILENELEKTKLLQKNLVETYFSPKSLFTQIAGEKKQNDFVGYEKTLSTYNKKFLVSAKNLVIGGADPEVDKIKEEGENLLSRIQGGLTYYDNANIQSNNTHLLTATTKAVNENSTNSCQQSSGSTYNYTYKGLYVIEKDKSYRLFDYIEELTGDEEYSPIDFDQDGDTDLLYIVGGELFLKENLTTIATSEASATSNLYVPIESNKFFQAEFIEAINGFKEINTDSGEMNLVFSAPTDTSINNFNLEFYSIVDKFLNEEKQDELYKGIVDSFVDIENITIIAENELYIKRKHLATINYVGAVPGVRLTTSEMLNINESIKNNTKAVLSPGTKLYSGKGGAKIEYFIGDEEEETFDIFVGKSSSLEFPEKVTIVAVNGNAYVQGDSKVVLTGDEQINSYTGLPLFTDSYIQPISDFKDKYNESSHIDISYYDGTQRSLNFEEVDHYFIYDLGHKSSDYLIRLNRPNDFYYTKIRAFKKDLYGTTSEQKLSSPQVEADVIAPELNFNGTVRIPVYQKETIDFTQGVYEHSGLEGISSVTLDFNLDVDTSGDGDPTNDSDTDLINIIHTETKIEIEFGVFDYLVKKKIGISLVDTNGNVGYTELDFEVYAPVPEIDSVNETSVQGLLDEKLFGEPVNLYRVRSGVITKLEDVSGDEKVKTVDDGVYNFDVVTTSSGLTLKNDGLDIAQINETTGNIVIKDFSSSIKITQDETYYPKVTIENTAGEELYSQYVKLPDNQLVVVKDDFATVEEEGIYVKFLNKESYNFYTIPTGASYSPGTLVIFKATDEKKEPIFTLFPDGRIKTANELYKLEYVSIGDYVGMKLISRLGNVEIAELLFRIEGSYLMK